MHEYFDNLHFNNYLILRLKLGLNIGHGRVAGVAVSGEGGDLVIVGGVVGAQPGLGA